MTMITRHFVDVRNPDGSLRRVHYRRAGSGPPVLLVHQSPRSSAEHIGMMERWAGHFTMFAPDSPGFGDSQPLPDGNPEVAQYAAAVLAFMDALGLETAGAYGMHSGAITLITAAKYAPQRFTAIAANGYAVWTEAEKADFGANYTPAFLPVPYGEHLAWLWGRLLEQNWFFPWYRTDNATRMKVATDDPARIHPIVMEVLAAGDTFRLGYAAMLRADRDLPEPGAPTPPVLIAAYAADPMQAHIARLGDIPPNWRTLALDTPMDVEMACRDWLLAHPAPAIDVSAGVPDEGFVAVSVPGFDGLLHWTGDRNASAMALHAPGSAASALTGRAGVLALDLPGHGLSDDWTESPATLDGWAAAVKAARAALGITAPLTGHGASAVLARRVDASAGAAGRCPAADEVEGWRAHGLPDLTPDRYGSYLQVAWQSLRAETFFWPWFAANPDNAIKFDPTDVAPERLAVRHLALMQARAGRPLLHACLDAIAAGGRA